MKDFRCAVFDLDGTLLDSMNVWKKVDYDFLGMFGLEVPGDYCEMISAMSFPKAAEYTIERFSLSLTPPEVMDIWNRLVGEEFANNVRLKSGAFEYLHYLKEKGIKLGVATASRREHFEAALKNNGVYHLFDAFVTVDEVERGKGFPDIYLEACRRLGANPDDSVVFEDIVEGIKGAKDGGFYVDAVREDSYNDKTGKIKALCDKYINDFFELLECSKIDKNKKYEKNT